ncbi:MAG: hypothetical protein IIY77_10385, partial [Lachnospiraceae bacterium]|nr:hypothetical protein [Lachnospiraceae bacterium]
MGTDKTALSGEVKIKMGKNRKESSKTEVKPAENDTPHTDRSNSFLPDSDMGIRGMKHRHRNGEVSGNPVPLTKPVSAPAPAPLSASVSASVPVSPAPLPAPADYPWHTISIRKSEVPDRSDITLEAANLPGGPQKFDWISVIFQPLGALLAIVAFLVILRVSGSGMSMGLYMLIGGVTSVLGILWGVLRYRSQKQQAEDALKNNEQRYREYLQRKEKEIAASASDQRRIMNDEAPSAAECAGMNERSPLLWSRSFEDKSFMKLRLGTGAVSFFRKINVPSPKYMEDNPLTEEARKLAERYRILENLPVCCDLRRSFTLGLTGERKDVAEEAMALMTEAAALHSYEDLKIVLLYPESEGRIWEAARFLPHVYDNDGEQRYIAGNKTQALELLKDITAVIEKRQEASREYGYSSEEESRPHYLIVVADLSYLGGNSYGKMLCPEEEGLEISTIFLARKTNQLPPQCRMIAEIEGNRAEFYDKAQYNKAVAFSPEKLDPEQWYGFLSDVSPVRLENPTVAKGIPRSLTFFEAYGINSPEELRLEKRWKEGRPERSMSVRLGAGRGGDIISFDIHPNKAGAHGVFVGGTSSGKTTMIRSWVLSMAAAFSPETVSFVLVDFKEPGLLTGLRDLPHVVGTVGKLDVDIDRNLTALRSEISRRQRLFDAADTINIYDYLEKHYAHEKAAEEPVRFLYIVVDELNEFKMWSRDGAGNDWMSLLDQLYQTGSSLGIHIIAGSQTPGPFSQVMLSNARFRWCLRTNEPGDSKEMLGDARAFGLKTKGRGFISVAGESEEIQPIYADSPYYTPEEKKSMPEQSMALLSLDGDRRTIKLRKGTRPSELEIIVKNIVDFTKRQHIPVPEKIWPERLPEIISLAELQAPPEEELCAVVGLVDDPVLQSQYSLEIDLDKSGGFLIYGAAQTGKTTFLRTFAVSLLEHNSPEKLEMYIIENAAGEFEGFEAYPQVRGLCDSFSSLKTVQKITEILKKRRRSRKNSEDKQIVLLVDNLNGIMEDNRSDILDIVRNGPGQGVYLAA